MNSGSRAALAALWSMPWAVAPPTRKSVSARSRSTSCSVAGSCGEVVGVTVSTATPSLTAGSLTAATPGTDARPAGTRSAIADQHQRAGRALAEPARDQVVGRPGGRAGGSLPWSG